MKPGFPIRAWILSAFVLGIRGLSLAQAPVGTLITNQAGVSYADRGGGLYTGRSETVQTPVSGRALLGVEVAADRSPAAPGDTVLLEIGIHNPGNVAAQGVTLKGALQDSLVQIIEADSSGVLGPGQVLWDTPFTLASGSQVTRWLKVRVQGTAPASAAFRFQVTAQAENVPEPVLASAQVPIGLAPNVVLAKQADREEITPGELITYTLTYINHGSAPALQVRLTDHLPAQVEFVSATPLPVQDQALLAWDLGDLSTGQSGKIALQVRTHSTLSEGEGIANRIAVFAKTAAGGEVYTAESPVSLVTVHVLHALDGQLSQPPQLFAGQNLKITLRDADLNTSSTQVDTIRVTTLNLRTGEREAPLLYETGPNTGEFVGALATGFGGGPGQDGDGRLIVGHQDLIRSLYTDVKTSSGSPVERSADTVVEPTLITLIPDPKILVANGTDQSILTARLTDAKGNPLPDGTLVRFSADQGSFASGELQVTIPVAGGNGEAQAPFTAPVLAKPDTVRVLASFEGFDSEKIALEVLPGAVGVRVYDEERGLEITAGDPHLEVELTLVGSTVTGDLVSMSVSVDKNGLFLVPELPPGSYQLRALVREIASGKVISDGELQQITVNADGSSTPPQNAISGTVRGRREESGARYAGSIVELLDAQGSTVASAALDALGNYDFQGIPPGEYTLRVAFQDGTTASRLVSPRSRQVGAVLVNTNILIDPFGTVFDAFTGAPVPGVVVTLKTLSGETLPIPRLAATGAAPNSDNLNPFVTTDQGRYAFLFGSSQVGAVGQPVTYLMALTPPGGSYLPRRLQLVVSPSRSGPIDEVPITLRALSADGLQLARPNSLALTGDEVVVPDIEVMAFNIPLFTQAPVIEFTKVALQDTARPGAVVDFRLVVANVGNDTAHQVAIADTLGQGWQLLSAEGSAAPAGNTVGWKLESLAPGQRDTLRLRAEVVAPQVHGTVLVNQAFARTDQGLPIQANAAVSISAAPVWALDKQANADSLIAGQEVEYLLRYRNIGSGTALGATLVDSLPPALVPLTAPGAAISGQVVRWPLGEVPVGAGDSLRLVARAAQTLQAEEEIVNRAYVFDADRQAAAITSSRVVIRPPHVLLSKWADSDTVTAGDQLTYSLRAQNEGPLIAAPVTLVDTLAAGLALVSATGDPAVEGGVLTWSFASLAAGQIDTLRLTARVISEAPVLVNTARLFQGGRPIALATVPVIVRPPPPLRIAKSADTGSVESGGELVYRLTVEATLKQLEDVVVLDTLPEAFAYLNSIGPSPAQYDSSARVLTWRLPQLLPEEPQTLQFSVTPRATLQPGEYLASNTAIATVGSERIASNAVEVLVCVPFFTLQKSADQTVAETGDFVVYRVKFANLSPGDSLANLVVRDQLPPGFDYVKQTARFDGQPLEPDRTGAGELGWQIPGLGAGRRGELTYRLVVGASAASEGTNTATASATTPHGLTIAAGPARAKVRLRADIFSQGEVILGRAWVDLNLNGLYDQGEPPVPGIALIMEDGTRVVADEQGRFSIPEIKPGDHVLRLLGQSIPPGLEPSVLGVRSARNPGTRFTTVSPAGLTKANFPFRRVSATAQAATRDTVAATGDGTPPAAALGRWEISTVMTPDSVFIDSSAARTVFLETGAFAPGESAPTAAAQKRLHQVAAQLASLPARRIVVSGHADSMPISTPQFPDNESLSRARAEAVKSLLVDAGTDSSLITTRAYGDRKPIAANRTLKGRTLNRRVEIESFGEIPFAFPLTRKTTAVYRGAPFSGQVQLVDSIGTAMTYLEGTALQAPQVTPQALIWARQGIAEGDSLRVTYQVMARGAFWGSMVLRVPAAIRSEIPGGEWATEIAVPGEPVIVMPRGSPAVERRQ